jgi:hypothetical protein
MIAIEGMAKSADNALIFAGPDVPRQAVQLWMRHARPLRIIYRTEHALALRNFADIKDPSKKPPPVIGVTAEQVENETSWVMAH